MRFLSRLAAALVLATCCACARAELAQVHIDYSVTTGELFSRCQEAVQSGRRQQAMTLLAEILDTHTNDLIETELGLYQPAAIVARQIVGQWPAAWIQELQAQRQLLAEQQWTPLEHSTNAADLNRFARRHFLSAQGAAACERIARLSIEAGQIDIARLQLADLLRYHPLRNDRGDVWRLLHSAALQLAGEPKLAQAATTQAAATRQVATRIGELPALATASQASGQIPDTANLTTLWQGNLTDQAGYGLGNKEPPPHWLPVPVVLQRPDFVVIQWDRHCTAYEPTSGTTMWDYQPLTSDEATRSGLGALPAPRRVAVWQQRVYVVTEVVVSQDQPAALKSSQSLSCLDAATGRVQWVRSAAEMMSRSEPAVLDGTPVAQDGRVYVAGRILRTGGYHDIVLLVVDARTGELLKQVSLFGTARAEYTPNERIKPVRLGLHNGILYAACSAGAVAAMDTVSCQAIWMRSFKPNGPASEQADQTREPQVPPCWADAPLIVADRLVIAIDTNVHFLDRWTGQKVAAVSLGAPIEALTKVGLDRARIATLVKGVVQIVDVEKGSVLRKLDTRNRRGAGMATMVDGSVLVSLANELQIVRDDGTNAPLEIDYVPAGIPVVANEKILLGTNGYLMCLGDGEVPLRTLQEEAGKGPTAVTAVQLVELSLRMGKEEEALTALRRALQQGAADPKRSSVEVVRQLHEICLTFGRHYTGKAASGSRQVAEELLEAAGESAQSPAERIYYHAAMANLRVAMKQRSLAVGQWQKVLSVRALRSEPLPEQLGGPNMTAGAWAQSQIAEQIARFGRGFYSSVDAEAATMLQEAQRAGNRQELVELLARYPNSQSVPAAQLSLGRLTVAGGDVRSALSLLRQAAVSDIEGRATQAQAMAGLSQAYERLGNTAAAAAWMARLATIDPQTRVEAGGRSSTAANYAEALAKRLVPGSPAVHRLNVPLRVTFTQSYQENVSLVRGSPGSGDTGAIALVWSAGVLQAIDVRRGQSVWLQPVPIKSEPRILTADRSQIVLHDRQQVISVEPFTGKILWRWTAQGPDIEAPGVDPESVPTIEDAGSAQDGVLIFTADKKTTCLDVATGRMRWHIAQGPVYVGNLAISEGLAVYRGNQAEKVTYVVLDARTGQQVSLWQPIRNLPAEAVEVLPTGTVMLISSNSVEGYDAYSGKMFWQVYAQGRFRTAARQRSDSSFYIADGNQHVMRIDTLTGKVVWRAQLRSGTGAATAIVSGDGLVWATSDRGCNVMEETSGKVLDPIGLPKDVPAKMEIREAVLCQAGLLAIVVQKGKQTPDAAGPILVLFQHHKQGSSAAVAATIEEGGEPMRDWQVKDGAVIVAAGKRVVGITGR